METGLWLATLWMVWFLMIIFWIPIRFFYGLFVDKRPFKGIPDVLWMGLGFAVITILFI